MSIFALASVASILFLSAIDSRRTKELAFSFVFGVVIATLACCVCAVQAGVWNAIRHQVDYVASALLLIPILTSLASGIYVSVVGREEAKVESKLLEALSAAEEVVGLIKPRDQDHGWRVLDVRKGLARAVANLESRRRPSSAWFGTRTEPYYKSERIADLDVGDLEAPEELKADLATRFEALGNLEKLACLVSRLDERPQSGLIG